MDETQMIDAIKRDVEVMRIADGVYIFEADGKFGTIKNYQQDEDHYQVMFDNLTPEQVTEVFATRRTAKRVSVPRESHVALGHYECGACGAIVGAHDRHCRHCGAELEGGW